MLGLEYRVRDYGSNAIAIQDEVPITPVMEELDSIGARVAWARKQRGLSQDQLAKEAGVAQSTIGSLESGLRKKPRELISIARALKISIAWAETGEGPWEADPFNFGNALEAVFVSVARKAGFAVAKLTSRDASRLPDWLRHFRGPQDTYVPDFEVFPPDWDSPVWVEVKAKVPGGSIVSARLTELAKEHPLEFVFLEMDLQDPEFGIQPLLDLAKHKQLAPHVFMVGSENIRVQEPHKSYGMEPILAWEHQDDLPEGEFVMVPRLDIHLSAGGGREQVEIDLVKENPQAFRSEWIRVMKLKPAKLAAMRATGESMEPTIHDGDSLLVDTSQTTVVDGKVYALWYDGGERVKRLFRLPGGALRIASDNPRFPALEVPTSDQEHVRIIGRIVHRSGVGGL